MSSYKMHQMNGEHSRWREPEQYVCVRCGMVMTDIEPGSQFGEFFHRNRNKIGSSKVECVNAGQYFKIGDSEITEFLRKKIRRAIKRIK